MNDDFYEQHTIGDLIFTICVTVGAVTAFVIALAVTL